MPGLQKRKRPQGFTPAARFGRMLPLRRTDAPQRALFPVTPPAQNGAGDNSHRNRSRQIVPEKHAKLCKRHVAALVAIATVRGYSLVVQASDSPRYVAGLYQTTCGGFLFPATDAAGDQAPATLRLTGKPGLATILLQTTLQLAVTTLFSE